MDIYKRIGLTGGIATGKSTVSRYLIGQGYTVIEADAVTHALYEEPEAVDVLRSAFGEGILIPSNASGRCGIDRARLSALVFSDAEQRRRLERIVHPMIYARMAGLADTVHSAKDGLILFDIPLLFETQALAQVLRLNEIWLVTIPKALQLKRLMRRDGLSADQAQARIAAQLPDDRKRSADYVLDNSGTRQALCNQVDRILAHHRRDHEINR